MKRVSIGVFCCVALFAWSCDALETQPDGEYKGYQIEYGGEYNNPLKGKIRSTARYIDAIRKISRYRRAKYITAVADVDGDGRGANISIYLGRGWSKEYLGAFGVGIDGGYSWKMDAGARVKYQEVLKSR